MGFLVWVSFDGAKAVCFSIVGGTSVRVHSPDVISNGSDAA